ncbi:MAG: CDP-alcohol phosphatidyltransferase family protein [Deltaproteobacteria bacterium]|nr:CDP-alcohol phosphatidyltransferase family protein [Deltaproteobacteria bacterium]
MSRFFPPLAYLNVPNVLTTLAALLGMVSLWALARGQVHSAAVAYACVLGLDHLDGIAARTLKQSTRLGLQLDSLADAVSFVVLPPVAGWMLGQRGYLVMASMAAYVVAGLWRLAYYNVHGLELAEGKLAFRGLPTTYVGAFFLVGVIWSHALALDVSLLAPAFYGVMAALMVSAVPVPKRGLLLPITGALVAGTVLAFTLEWIGGSWPARPGS